MSEGDWEPSIDEMLRFDIDAVAELFNLLNTGTHGMETRRGYERQMEIVTKGLLARHGAVRCLLQSRRPTPAMEAGVADHVWSLEEIAGLLDGAEAAWTSNWPTTRKI